MLSDNSMNVVMAMIGYYSDIESSKDHFFSNMKTRRRTLSAPL